MKIILASLMCLVLGASQCFAIKGGPNYGGSGHIIGTYAGVMQGELGTNGLGIFTISVPQTGLASGLFIIFQSGLFLNGTLQAVADGTQKQITALLHAEATKTEIFGGTVTIMTVAVADGQMVANVSTTNSLTSGTRLSGTAVVNEHGPDDQIGDPMNDKNYLISGFQQSSSPPSG